MTKPAAQRLNRRNRSHCDTRGGSQTFRPQIDYAAKWHRHIDDLMHNRQHLKAMAKVTLPKIVMKEPASVTAEQTVKKALDDYFRSEPPPSPAQAKEFLQGLLRDITIMLMAIETRL